MSRGAYRGEQVRERLPVDEHHRSALPTLFSVMPRCADPDLPADGKAVRSDLSSRSPCQDDHHVAIRLVRRLSYQVLN